MARSRHEDCERLDADFMHDMVLPIDGHEGEMVLSLECVIAADLLDGFSIQLNEGKTEGVVGTDVGEAKRVDAGACGARCVAVSPSRLRIVAEFLHLGSHGGRSENSTLRGDSKSDVSVRSHGCAQQREKTHTGKRSNAARKWLALDMTGKKSVDVALMALLLRRLAGAFCPENVRHGHTDVERAVFERTNNGWWALAQ